MFRILHLAGTTRNNEKRFRTAETELTKQGYICFTPVIYDLDVYLEHKNMIDQMCTQKPLICDALVIVTPEHIGRSTSMRIKQAVELGKSIYLWEDGKLSPIALNVKGEPRWT